MVGLVGTMIEGTHVVMLPTMVGFVRLLIMKNARSFATNHGETCMINVLRCYARSYATNNGETCMINVLRCYARSYATNNGELCKTADNKGKG